MERLIDMACSTLGKQCQDIYDLNTSWSSLLGCWDQSTSKICQEPYFFGGFAFRLVCFEFGKDHALLLVINNNIIEFWGNGEPIAMTSPYCLCFQDNKARRERGVWSKSNLYRSNAQLSVGLTKELRLEKLFALHWQRTKIFHHSEWQTHLQLCCATKMQDKNCARQHLWWCLSFLSGCAKVNIAVGLYSQYSLVCPSSRSGSLVFFLSFIDCCQKDQEIIFVI